MKELTKEQIKILTLSEYLLNIYYTEYSDKFIVPNYIKKLEDYWKEVITIDELQEERNKIYDYLLNGLKADLSNPSIVHRIILCLYSISFNIVWRVKGNSPFTENEDLENIENIMKDILVQTYYKSKRNG